MADFDHKGTALVALIPPVEMSEDLLVQAGRTDADLDEQHITVVFLPDTSDFSADDLMAAVTNFAEVSTGLMGSPNGWGRFDTPDGSCQIALWDLPGWSNFRENLVVSLNASGIFWEDTHGSIPHQTMGWDGHEVTSIPTAPKAEPIIFGDIHVWYDDEHVGSAPLSSPGLEAVASMLLTAAEQDDDWDHEDEQKHPRANDGKFRSKNGPADGPKSPKSKAPDQAKPEKPEKPEDSKDQKVPGKDEKKPEPDSEPEEIKAPEKRTPFVKDKPRTKEEAAKRGDVYGEYLPAGKYPEGDPRNDPEFEKQHNEAKALTEKYVKATKEDLDKGIGGDTEVLYNKILDEATGETNSYRPDRQAKHAAVRDRILKAAEDKKVPKGGRMVIMAGPSGAGKSSFLNKYGKEKLGIEGDNPADDPENFVVINPDNFKDDVEVDLSRYPGLNENELAAIKHEESSDIAEQVARSVVKAGFNVIFDITLGSASSAERKYLNIPGADQYTDVQVALVDGDMARSRHNAGNRWKQPDRKSDTWERSWKGRFIGMELVEHQKPTKVGYRSKNAQEFEDLVTRRSDRVGKSWIFEPDDESVREGKSPAHEGLDQREALSQRLKTLLRNSINDMMSTQEGSKDNERIAFMSGSEKDVFYWIDKYKGRKISDEELVKGLTEDVTYKNKPQSPYPKGSPEWYEWVENEAAPKGSIREIYDEIPQPLVTQILEIIHERAEKRS